MSRDISSSSNNSNDDTHTEATSPIDFARFSSSMHPGHVLMTVSLPMLIQSYRLYQQPLESLVLSKLQPHRILRIEDLPSADEPIRRSVAYALASRALRIATLASTSMFGVTLASLFYASGCATVQQALDQTREWAVRMRCNVDQSLGVSPMTRMNADHPEIQAIAGLKNERDEWEYIQKTYLYDINTDDAMASSAEEEVKDTSNNES